MISVWACIIPNRQPHSIVTNSNNVLCAVVRFAFIKVVKRMNHISP